MTSRGRSFVALGAYVCLSAQLLGLLHVLVVRHATCPSHGEVTHRIVQASAAIATPQGIAVQSAPGAALEEPDEHCLVMAIRRRELAGLSPAPAATPAPPAPVRAAVLNAPATVAPPLLLLDVAPKTSPPA